MFSEDLNNTNMLQSYSPILPMDSLWNLTKLPSTSVTTFYPSMSTYLSFFFFWILSDFIAAVIFKLKEYSIPSKSGALSKKMHSTNHGVNHLLHHENVTTLPSCGSTVTGIHYCRSYFQCVRIPPKLPLGRYIQGLLFCLIIFNQRRSPWFGKNSNLLKQNLNIFSLYLFGLGGEVSGHTRGTWKFLSQGSIPSCSCDLCHSCGNTRALTHYSMQKLHLFTYKVLYFFIQGYEVGPDW